MRWSVIAAAIVSLGVSRPHHLRNDPTSPNPAFWVATRGDARVYILGFGEARDTSWLTPVIRRAFDASSDLWLETGGGLAPDGRDEATRRAAAERIDRMGRDSTRTLFDALEPPVRERTRAYLEKLGVRPDSVARFRPWRAYYAIISAFFAGRKAGYQPVFPDAILARMAYGAGKQVGYEMPTRESFAEFMAAMSDREQSQYIEWLLDFLDDYDKGLNDEEETFGWIEGRKLPFRSLDRMRTRTPDLYQVMQPRRNRWWADKIDSLLAAGGSHFVAVGQLHVMGPDGIPEQLKRLGITPEPVSSSPARH